MTKIAIVQLNPIPGDFDQSGAKILDAFNKIPNLDSWTEDDWIVFSFGALSGFPLDDLRFNPGFVRAYKQAWEKVSNKLPQCKANLIFRHPGSPMDHRVLEYGKFRTENNAVDYKILIETNPVSFNINPNQVIYTEFKNLCAERGKPGVFCNLVGGQDSLMFEGGSFVCNEKGQVIASAKRWEEDIVVCSLDDEPVQVDVGSVLPQAPEEKRMEDVYHALTMGIKDYVEKNGFDGAVIGLSGGIDSALVAALATAALGPNRVTAVTMPSQYSSYETLRDANLLAANLGLKLHSLPIKEPYNAFNNVLAPVLKQFDAQRDPQNLTDQNLQARLRGVYLMALSNRTGRVVLNTSNKSEGSVGYGTLYGDLVGGLSVLIDLWKTDVWALSRWINKHAGKEIIPVSTIDRVPSAELRPHQEDRHSIPDYPVLDPIMKMFVEEEKSLEEIVAAGFDRSAVELALKLYNRNEFKRRQCPPGLYLTSCPLAQKQRPMTSRFTE